MAKNIELNKIKDPSYNIVCLGIDNGVSQGLSIIMQYLANLGTNIFESISFVDYDKISNHITYKSFKSDEGMVKSVYEGMKYSFIYPHLNIEYYKKHYNAIDDDFISKRLPKSKRPNIDDAKRNVIIVTSSTTSIETINSVKYLVENSTRFKTVTHIHLETGNKTDGGAIFAARSTKDTIEVQYPESFNFINNDYRNNIDNYPQAILSGAALLQYVVNLISFNMISEDLIKFNADKLSIGPFNPRTNEVNIPLLGKKKVYKKKKIKKRGRKRTVKVYKKLTDSFDIIFVGTGATGSFALSYLIPILNELSDRVRSLHIIDGDVVERKNALNQRCLLSEAGESKVEALQNRISKAYPSIKVVPHANYILDFNEDTIKSILGVDSIKDRNILLAFNVDNDETRKLSDNFFRSSTKVRNLLSADSGNGTSERAGQFVMGLKQYDKTILQPIGGTDFGSGVRKNQGDIYKLFGTCTRESSSHPQHISTNGTAGVVEAVNIFHTLRNKKVKTHINHFGLESIYLSAR